MNSEEFCGGNRRFFFIVVIGTVAGDASVRYRRIMKLAAPTPNGLFLDSWIDLSC
ncbi:MAG: hypothetical protein K9N48_01645 [Verrucomicrobia bacterium]|nr:hypothetical protein [Verrucomicrobiota bacterium]MCF7707445.1 hypothetical protein [Verrucomicrobiota bacterium]